jgi:hypothetical protein
MQIELSVINIANIVYLRSLGFHEGDIIALYSLSKRLHRYAERDCNRGLTCCEQTTVDGLLEDVHGVMKRIQTSHPKVCFVHKTDPRAGAGIVIVDGITELYL